MPFVRMAAQTDTLLNVASQSRLVITEDAGGTYIEVAQDGRCDTIAIAYGEQSTVRTSQHTSHNILRLPFTKEYGEKGGENRWTVGMSGVCIGLTDAQGQPSPGGLQWSKSFEISWMSCLNVNYSFSRSSLSLGFGFDWRNYKATANGDWLVPAAASAGSGFAGGSAAGFGTRGIAWGEAPEGVRVRYSRLKTFSLQLPLLYSWAVPKTSLGLRVGPVACFNTYGSLKGVYDDADGNRCEYFTKDLDIRPFTVDFFGCLSYRHYISLYVRWSPMKVMQTGSPINFRPLTVGFGFLL